MVLIMLLWLLFLGSVISTPTDEFREHTRNGAGDYLQKNFNTLQYIIPGLYAQADMQALIHTAEESTFEELMKLEPNNKFLKHFNNHVEKGTTTKGLTFSIYDDNMREAAVALYRVFETTEGEVFHKVRDWAKNNVNTEMYMYALRLESLYTSKTNESFLYPPFIWNPNYFVNAEVLDKAAVIANDIISNGKIDQDLAKTNEYRYASGKYKQFVIVNSNYSMWNLPQNDKQDNLNYFREDVGLNSHYLGIHFMHPFWMSNEELEYNNPRFAEHYYYAHQQLMARYNLERLHTKSKLKNTLNVEEYIPYLKYKNGLPFPTRSGIRGNWDEQQAYMKNIDIAIRECIARGLIIMENGTMITMTEDSHIDILSKLIRGNLDSAKTAKIARAMVGYGSRNYPIDEYNPAPSALHHPETSLRDPVYWLMIEHTLKYFTDYKNNMEPFDLTKYECDDFVIVDNELSKITTQFRDFSFSINHAISNTYKDFTEWQAYLSVKQRRLTTNSGLYFNFTVESAVKKDTIVRLYLGPECNNNCWDVYNNFYEIDTFAFSLQEGINTISWYPEMSDRLSLTYDFNSPISKPGSTKYSIFRFPTNLLIPHGLEEGLNLTLFFIITPAEEDTIPYPPTVYRQFSKEYDSKPLGFPFHRKAVGFKDTANNYKFYNITIYHESQLHHHNGYFSPHLL